MAQESERFSRLDYCQFLLSSQTNYTMTYLAEHTERFSHDAVERYLRGEKITPRLLWEQVRPQLVASADGCLIFDDTVLDHNHARHMALVRRQYSGNEHRVIRGIGVVSCIYVNPEQDRFWVIDYRLYSPESDGKSKLDHVAEMLQHAVHQKQLPLRRVLMDTWYATRPLMREIEQLGKLYYCPLKENRKVDDSDARRPYGRVDELRWSAAELEHGKLVHLKDFPKGHRVKLFRLVLSSERTDYIATNDLAQDSAQAAQEAGALRWKIEQFHREAKQTTGIERCQARAQRIQRNHIGCALLVWVRLKQLAHESGQSIYALKQGLLDDYMIQQLRAPSILMTFA